MTYKDCILLLDMIRDILGSKGDETDEVLLIKMSITLMPYLDDLAEEMSKITDDDIKDWDRDLSSRILANEEIVDLMSKAGFELNAKVDERG